MSRAVTDEEVIALVYELLDAHIDTLDLCAQSADQLCWEAHLDYLRALQRTGKRTLAQVSVAIPAQ
jgi:hypothetical protein